MRGLLVSAMVVLLCSPAAWGQKAEPRAEKPEPRVKTSRTGMSVTQQVKGVVDKIDADGMTLVEVLKTGEVREHKLAPTDLLRDGETQDSVTGRFTCRWQDVKRGDELEVVQATDHIDKLTYCETLSILKRPNGKLPAWQKGDNPDDKVLFAQLSMFNDLTNGEDVSDDDVKTLFPPRPKRVDGGGVTFPAHPGGLPKQYQEKLDAIRAKAKKEKDLKAAPPEKK